MALDELCEDPATPVCMAGTGCVAGSGCTSDADCDDTFACTLDVCGAGGTCEHTAIDARCTGAGERCSLTMGCYAPRSCTTAEECQDDNFCNGAEECMPEFGCAPASAPRTCNDSDSCTVDTCDTGTDMCVFACDRSRSECGCPVTGPTCSGRFRVTGSGLSYSCAFGMVSYDLSELTFEAVGGALIVRARSMTFADLVDDAAPVCPTFVAQATVGGMCPEVYRVEGTFTDDDHFTGTFSTSFGGGECEFFCMSMSVPITGERIP
jgi:hypothetical protein